MAPVALGTLGHVEGARWSVDSSSRPGFNLLQDELCGKYKVLISFREKLRSSLKVSRHVRERRSIVHGGHAKLSQVILPNLGTDNFTLDFLMT
jgi:hypothetical protein